MTKSNKVMVGYVISLVVFYSGFFLLASAEFKTFAGVSLMFIGKHMLMDIEALKYGKKR